MIFCARMIKKLISFLSVCFCVSARGENVRKPAWILQSDKTDATFQKCPIGFRPFRAVFAVGPVRSHAPGNGR